MKLRRCTAFLEDGRTDAADEGRCGTYAECTRVVIRAGAGSTVIRHWVCADCRERMDLPARNVDIIGGRVVEPSI